MSAEFPLEDTSDKYKLVNNIQDFLEVLERIEEVQPSVMAVDTETEGLKWRHRVIGISFTFSETDNYYIPFRHVTEDFQPEITDFVEALNYIFNLPNCEYVFHNFKFDYHKLKREGIEVSERVHDTMIMHFVLDENYSHALKELAVLYVDKKADHYEKLIKEFRRKLARKLKIKISEFGFEHIPIPIMVEYACRDTYYTYKLYEIFKPKIDECKDATAIYGIEMDALWAFCEMEQNGVKLDTEALAKVSNRLGAEIEEIKSEVWEMVGQEFDLSSPKQIREILQSKGIHTRETTATGAMSTSVSALEKVSKRFPFVQKILDYRTKAKLKGTYADPLPEYCDEEGFIHCSYKQIGAVTGRITCKDPSLQVIPRNAGENDIRRAFVPPDDEHVMLFIDLSQIELRKTAILSKDELLLSAYDLEEDIHSRTAAEIFDVDIDKVSKHQRTASKCFHPDTEVLTKSGWKAIGDLEDGEEVIQATPARGGSVSLDWVTPTEVFTKNNDYDHLIHLKSKGIDLLVTPDHRMLGFGCTGKVIVTSPDKFNKVRTYANSGVLSGGNLGVDSDVLRVAVATQAEGSVNSDSEITFGFSKECEIRRLELLLETAGISYTKTQHNNVVTRIYILKDESKQVLSLLEEKQFPWWWVELDIELRNTILDEVKYWDSHTRDEWRMFRYSSINKQSIDVLQAIASISNRKTRLVACQRDNPKHHCLYGLTIRDKHDSRGENTSSSKVPYTGKIACLSVPSSFVLVRGKDTPTPVITGQSINFGIIYGIGPKKLAEQLSISQDEAYLYISTYLKRYSGVDSFIKKYQRLAKKHGYVKTLFGRTRHLDELQDPQLEDWKRERGYRQAVNYVVQGCQHPDTPILTDRGYIPIKDLDGECLRTYSGYTNMYKVFPCGEQRIYRVKTNFGSTLNSPDHKYFVYDSGDIHLKDTKDLVEGDAVLFEVPSMAGARDNIHISHDNLELIGLLCGGGNFPVDSSEKLYLKVPVNREGHFDWVVDYLSTRWSDKWELKRNGDPELGIGHVISTTDEDIISEFREWGVSNITSCNREIPSWLFEANIDQRCSFLRGLFCSTAYFTNKQVLFKCPTYYYANTLQLLLTCIGVNATLHERENNRKDKRYLVRVLPSSLGRFITRVGSRDAYTLQMIKSASVDENSCLPKSLVKDTGKFIKTTPEYLTKDETFSFEDKSYIQQMFRFGYGRRDKIIEFLKRVSKSDVQRNFMDLVHKSWALVSDVTDTGEHIDMLDIEIEDDDHAYVARGFYQHNSCADMFKITLAKLHEFLKDKKSKMVMNIHDEVIFYLHLDEVDIVGDIKKIFEDWDFRVPIVADVQYSDESWGNKKDI